MRKVLLRMGLLMLAGIIFNGCAAMAVRTGVKAAKAVDERIEERQAAEPGQESQAQRPRLINRPGLLHPDQEQAPTNSIGTAEAE